MFSDTTACPYCSKTFRNAGPFDKHLRVFHPGHASSFYNNHTSRRKGLNEAQKDSDHSERLDTMELDDFAHYESHDEAEEEDIHQLEDSDAESESEIEEINNEPDDSRPTRREYYEFSGQSYGSVVGEEERIRDLLRNPWYPFRNASEFKLARFFVEANIPWEQIDSFMKASLAPPDVYFSSAYTLRKLLDKMDNSLGPESWNQGDVIFSGTKVPFYFRNPIDCVKYLIRQKAYQSDLIYAPEKLFEDEERQYGELHTADWWWDTQVCTDFEAFQKAYKGLPKFRWHFRKAQRLYLLSVPQTRRISQISRGIKRRGQSTLRLEISGRQHGISRPQWR
jgi:hypothetical protein